MNENDPRIEHIHEGKDHLGHTLNKADSDVYAERFEEKSDIAQPEDIETQIKRARASLDESRGLPVGNN